MANPNGNTLALAVPRGTPRDIEFTTLPHAACKLRLVSVPTDAGMELHSDAHGTVRFSFEQPLTGAISEIDTFALECLTAIGDFQRDLFEVHSDQGFRESPAQSNELYDEGGTILPPLTGDVDAMTQSELLSRGYPPRPDSVIDPAAYLDWLANVSRPIRLLPPDLTPLEGHYHALSDSKISNDFADSSNNYSGYYITSPGSQPYTLASGGWQVPTVIANESVADTLYSSLWVGVDGIPVHNLIIQAGTEQYITINPGHPSAISYSAWIEYLPNNAITISNLAIHAGDTVTVLAYCSDSAGTAKNNGGFGYFQVNNNTTGKGYRGSIPQPSGTTFIGESLEWIMERPTINGSIPHLADYQTASQTVFGYSYDNNGTPVKLHNLNTDTPTRDTMYNDGTFSRILSAAQRSDATHVNYTFQNSF